MHEMSLVEGIRAIVEDNAKKHNFSRVKTLTLEIGPFAGVEKPALAFAFDVVMKGSPGEGAQLDMVDLPGKATCFDCEKEIEIPERLSPCPLCGGGKILTNGGDELRISTMEVE